MQNIIFKKYLHVKNSKYNILFSFNKAIYIYNSLSTAIISIDKQVKEILISDKINLLPTKVFDTLKDNGFIVEKELNETDAYYYYYETTRFANSLKKINLTIIPTYFCNLSCSYCIQDCKKENKIIGNAGINSIVNFAENELKKTNIEKMMLTFYGGEPLLAKNGCIKIAEKLHYLTSKKSIGLDTYIVTNGTLIDQEIIDRLFVPYKMYMQISIDGIENSHDKKRYFKNKKGTFNIISKNIDLLNRNGLKDFITIRINIDRENISEADEIVKLFKDKSNDIYFGLLTPQGNNTSNIINCISSSDCALNYDYKFSQILSKYDINPYGSKFGKKMPCADNSENKYMIDQYLDVYKCDLLLGNKKYRVGYISDFGKFSILPQFYEQVTRNPFIFIKCIDCKLLPACAGGCAAKSAIERNTFKMPYCEITKNELINYVKNFILANA